jgi:hypothetical protein
MGPGPFVCKAFRAPAPSPPSTWSVPWASRGGAASNCRCQQCPYFSLEIASPSFSFPAERTGTGHRAESRVNVIPRDARALSELRRFLLQSEGDFSLLSNGRHRSAISLRSLLTAQDLRECPMESILEFPKVAAANEGIGPREVNDAVDLGTNNRGVWRQF